MCLVEGREEYVVVFHNFSNLLLICKRMEENIAKYVGNLNEMKFWKILYILTKMSMYKLYENLINQIRYYISGNALARVQRVHEPADLWDITFCTRWFWGF